MIDKEEGPVLTNPGSDLADTSSISGKVNYQVQPIQWGTRVLIMRFKVVGTWSCVDYFTATIVLRSITLPILVQLV
jgi:hypothetical protein